MYKIVNLDDAFRHYREIEGKMYLLVARRCLDRGCKNIRHALFAFLQWKRSLPIYQSELGSHFYINS